VKKIRRYTRQKFQLRKQIYWLERGEWYLRTIRVKGKKIDQRRKATWVELQQTNRLKRQLLKIEGIKKNDRLIQPGILKRTHDSYYKFRIESNKVLKDILKRAGRPKPKKAGETHSFGSEYWFYEPCSEVYRHLVETNPQIASFIGSVSFVRSIYQKVSTDWKNWVSGKVIFRTKYGHRMRLPEPVEVNDTIPDDTSTPFMFVQALTPTELLLTIKVWVLRSRKEKSGRMTGTELVGKILIDKHDRVGLELGQQLFKKKIPIKTCLIKRVRKSNNDLIWMLHLTLGGSPLSVKVRSKPYSGGDQRRVGIDVGPQNFCIAIPDTDEYKTIRLAKVNNFEDTLRKAEQEEKQWQKDLDRSRRATNPQLFYPDGRFKPGHHQYLPMNRNKECPHGHIRLWYFYKWGDRMKQLLGD
jgi:hypothetical protein